MNGNTPLPAEPPAMPKTGGSGSKWVFFGCGGCLILIVLGVMLAGVITLFVFNIIKKTDVYADGFKKAQNSAQVQAALGTPVEEGWWITGSVNMTNGTGIAEVSAPIKGPKGEGTLILKADKSLSGPWVYSVLEVHSVGGEKINLLESP